MRYVISDIHGCYDQYKRLLEVINFGQEDELYVLGDVVDRGPEPIRVLQDMMARQNVNLILGNHDFMMYSIMEKMTVEITEDNFDSHLSIDDILSYRLWIGDGGMITATKYRELSFTEKQDILDYLADASLYEVLEHEDETFILVHGGLGDFDPNKPLEEYELFEILEERTDYSKRYFDDEKTYLVTGHTPTLNIQGWERAEVYQRNGHIALDCCCVGGGKLAAFCIETKEIFYV